MDSQLWRILYQSSTVPVVHNDNYKKEHFSCGFYTLWYNVCVFKGRGGKMCVDQIGCYGTLSSDMVLESNSWG